MGLLSAFVDLIYPPVCLICGQFLRGQPVFVLGRGIDLCTSCYSSFKRITRPICPTCGHPYPESSGPDHLCEQCMVSPPAYDMITTPFVFDAPLVDAIHSYKYGGKTHYAKSFGPLLAQFASDTLYFSQIPIVMPVPLHPKRLRERGFNQSLLLARYVAKELEGHLDFLSLVRTRYTPSQTKLNRSERINNLKGAFELNNPDVVKDRTVIVVDDVVTTGTTVNECAKVLKKAGAGEVLAVALARAV